MIMGMFRTKKQGTFDLDFELNQMPWTDLSRGPYRTEGDIAVGFELSGNPDDPQADLFVIILRYDPNSTGNNTATGDPYVRNYANDGSNWWVVFEDYASASVPGVFEATMNDTNFPAPPSPPFSRTLDASGKQVYTVEPFFFAEAALNLTALGLEVGCPGFGTVHAKTRSSLEISADLKDLAGPETLEVRCYLFGNKYEDMDGDGDIAEDTGNPLSDWEIRLWRDEDGDGLLDETQDMLVATTTTDPNGYYMFNGLSDGVYHVQEVLEPGWTQSYPLPPGIHEGITIDINNTVSGPHDFGNWRPATKTGVKFEDLDADGAAREGSEPGLAGWTIYVDYENNGILDGDDPSAVTSGDGSYTINGIKPGTFRVREVLQTGWINSFPPSEDAYGRYHEEVFTSGATLSDNDFGNWAPGTKSGYKYEDLNGNGDITEDTGNPLSGWTIRAYNDEDADGILEQPEYDAGPVVTSNTDIAGAYSLTLDPGDYIIVEVLQNNWLQSYPGTNVLAPGLITGSETLGSSGYAITMTSRDTHTDNNFGNYQSADLEVTKSGMITYTIRVTNNGPSTASNVVLDDELPGNLNWGITQVSPEFTTINITDNTLHGTIDSLASEMHAEVTVGAPIPQGDDPDALLPNTATASSDTPDLNTDNNSADADIGPLP